MLSVNETSKATALMPKLSQHCNLIPGALCICVDAPSVTIIVLGNPTSTNLGSLASKMIMYKYRVILNDLLRRLTTQVQKEDKSSAAVGIILHGQFAAGLAARL